VIWWVGGDLVLLGLPWVVGGWCGFAVERDGLGGSVVQRKKNNNNNKIINENITIKHLEIT
jgi:hypothetical protein